MLHIRLLCVNKNFFLAYLLTYLMFVQFSDPVTWAWPDDVMVPGQNGDKLKRRKSKWRHQNGDNPKRRTE